MTAERRLGQPRSAPSIATWPGFRTFRSERFRLLVGALLWAVGTLVVGYLLFNRLAVSFAKEV